MVKNVLKRTLSLLMVVLTLAAFIPQIAWADNVNTGVDGLAADSSGAATWTYSNRTITGSVTASSSTSCGSTTYTARDGTLTFTNNSGATALLSFDYKLTLSGGSATVDGADVTADATFNKRLDAGETVAVSITSNAADENETTITISNIKLTAEQNVYVTFKAPTNGSYTVDGTAITADTVETIMTTDSVALAATPASGYKFFGWYSETNNSYFSTAASTTTSFTESQTVYPVFVSNSTPVFQVGPMLFTDLNDAVRYAQWSGIAKIALISNGTLPAGDYTIPNGKTLVIPFDEAQTVYTTSPGMTLDAEEKPASHVTPSAFRTLTMASGAKITVATGGTISVPSMLSAVGTNSGSWNATPTGKHGRITMNAGSSIDVQSGGKLYVYGYIAGSGNVYARSGAEVWECFQIRCWRGGTATSGMADNYQKVFPLNQYYVQNIEAPITYYPGATEKVFAAVNMSSQQFGASATFIGNGGMFQLTNGSVTKRFTGTTDRLELAVDGDFAIKPMSLKITGLPLVGTLNLNTSDYVLPIQSNITFNVNSGTTTLSQDVAFLPGSEMDIANGATVAVANGHKAYVYDKDQWGAYAAAGLQLVPVGYSTVNGTDAKRTAASLVDVKIDVNGTLNVAGQLYTTESGAAIVSSGGTGKVVLQSAPGTEENTYMATQSGSNITYVSIPITAAKLQHADGTYYETAGKPAGTEVPYANGRWGGEAQQITVKFDANGGSGSMDDVTVNPGDTITIPDSGFTPPAHQHFLYWTCDSIPGEIFNANVEYTVPTSVSSTELTLKANWEEHTYGEVTYEWAADNSTVTATHICTVCGDVETETVNTTSEVTTPATCTEKGKTTYTATFTNPAFVNQTKTVENIAALGHDLVHHDAKAATCTEIGWNAYDTCSRCDYTTYVEIPAHGHTPGEAVHENEVAATCTKEGSYDEVVYCTVCGVELSRETKTIEKLAHTPGEAVHENEVAATCTEEGSYDEVVYCTVCHAELSREKETIEALGHDWGDPVWTWAEDNTATATFTCANDSAHVETITAAVSIIDSKDATCTSSGYRVYYATANFSGKTYFDNKTVTIPATGHTDGEPVRENEIPATCAAEGSYDEVVYCAVCHAELSRETKTIEALGHDYEAVVTAPTCTERGYTTYTCSRCDDSYVDDYVDAMGHDWGVWAVTNAPTCTEKGVETHTCTRCDATETREVAALGHDLVHHEAKEATCTEIGWNAYDTCSRCDYTTYVEIPAHGHTAGEPVKENNVEPSCEMAGGYDMVTYCTICHEKLTTEHTDVPALGHAWGDPTYVWANDNSTVTATRVCKNDDTHVETETVGTIAETTDPTCEGVGATTYTATFENKAFEKQTKTVEIGATGHNWGEPTYTWSEDNSSVTATRVCGNNAEHVETETVETSYAVTTAATCESAGVGTYTATFTNTAFVPQTKTETITAIGHDWGDPTYEWSDDNSTVTATRVCKNDDTHVETETVGTIAETTDPTCEGVGATTYTATFENKAFEKQTKTVEIGAIGHNWDEPTYVWTKDGNDWICTAKRVCRNDPSHMESESATVARTENGNKATYTATFTNEAFKTQTKVVEIYYYLTGSMTAWKVNESYRLVLNENAQGEEYMLAAKLSVGDQIKVVRAEDEKILDWYPTGNNYTVVYATSGNVNVYFRPAGNYWNDFHEGGYIYISRLHTVNIVTDGNGSASINPASPDFTANVTLTATPNNGYHFDRTEFYKKTGEGANDLELVDLGWNNETKTFQMPDYDIVIKVFFEKHSFDAATYEWTEDNGSVTARHSCTKCSFVETETVTTTAEVTRIATCTEKGETTYTATFTNNDFETQTKTVENIPATGHAWGDPTYGWADDCSTCTATRVCANDASHVETETATISSEVTKAATCTEKGETTYTATFTNPVFETQTKTVENIPALGHTPGEPVEENRIEPDCTTPGSYDLVTYCSVCHKELSREVVELAALGHDWDDGIVSTAPGCTDSGVRTYTCLRCGETRKEVIDATGHTPGEAVKENEVAATCTLEGGYDLVVHCTKCGSIISSEHFSVDALGHDFGEWETISSPTCTEPGTQIHICSRCDATESREIEATGHDWDTSTYEWAENNSAVTATRVCKNDASHVETETVSTISEVTKEATCETMGETTYTATFTNAAFATQAKSVQDIDAIGHDWDIPAYEWAEDNSVVTATHVCKNDASHVETETVSTTGEVTKEATCETMGETTYTATFNNTEFAKQTKTVEEIPALGHAWGEPTFVWAAGNTEATVSFVCANDPNHVWTAFANVTVDDDAGYMVYTATVVGPDDVSYSDTKRVKITGSLTITRGEAVEQDFLYSVMDGEGNLIVRVVLAKGKTRVKIVGLPVGTYIVKEESSWSWRYSPEENPQTAVITAQERTATVTFQEETGHMPSSEWVTDIALPNKREDGLQDED